jgi:hypothetical protein
LNEVIALYRVVEHYYADSLATEVFGCRLDLIRNSDTVAAYGKIGSGRVLLPNTSQSIRDSLKAALLTSPLAQSVAKHEVTATGEIDTVWLETNVPVEVYRYDVILNGSSQYRLWLSGDVSTGISAPLLSSLEQEIRNSGFVASEQFRRMINLVLLRGVEYPPGSSEIRDDLMLVRFDNRRITNSLIAQSTVFEFQLESAQLSRSTELNEEF